MEAEFYGGGKKSKCLLKGMVQPVFGECVDICGQFRNDWKVLARRNMGDELI